MSRRITDEQLNVEMKINGGNAAQSELGKLDKANRDLKQSNDDLRKAKKLLEAQDKKNTDQYKKLSKQLTDNNKQLQENRKRQSELRKELGLTGLTTRQLVKEQKSLRSALASTTPGTAEWKKYKTELQAVDNRLGELRNELKGTRSVMNSTNGSIVQQGKSLAGLVTGITGFVAILQAGISLLKDFISSSRELAIEAKGVEFAFKRLGDRGQEAFEKIKASTRGTLSDLEIKKSINEFEQFNLSLERSNTLFEFLSVSALQSGKDVTKLKDSLVEGLSKQSKLRIDNLGISASELNEELKKTPEFIDAVANIAERKLAKAGPILDKAASGAAKWSAGMENLKVAFGQLFQSNEASGFLSLMAQQLERITAGVKLIRVGFRAFGIALDQLLSPLNQIVNQLFPGLNGSLLNLAKALTTDAFTLFGTFMLKLSGTIGGMVNLVKTLKDEFLNFFKTLSVFSQIEIDLFNPAKTFASIRNFDFTKAFSDIRSQLSESGGNIASAFSEGYSSILEQAKETNETVADEITTKVKEIDQALIDAEKERLEKIASLEEEYLRRREDREADSAIKRIELERQRALAEAEALRASNELIRQINAEFDAQVAEQRLIDQEKELQELAAFELKKAQLLNELALQQTESDREKEQLLAEQKLLKQEEEFMAEMERLALSEEERTQVIVALAEIRRQTLFDINKKWNDKEIAEDEKLAAQKRALLTQSLDAAVNAAGAETKVGQALLLAKQLLAGKEMAIRLGLLQAKVSADAAEATSATAVGTANTAKIGFPQNIPLLIAFAAQIAGIIATIRKAGKTKIKTSGFEDGLFPSYIDVKRDQDGRSFRAKHGGGTRTQIVRQPTYFNDYLTGENGPEMIIDSNTFRQLNPQVINHILSVNRGVRGYQDGLLPQSSANNTASNAVPSQDFSELQTTNRMLLSVISRLSEQLDNGLVAKTYYGYEEELKRQAIQNDITRSQNNAILS